MKLTNPTDDQLNAAFANKVAGWTYGHDEGWRDENGFSRTEVDYNDFTHSATAALPWLERGERFDLYWTWTDGFRITVWDESGNDHFSHDKNFPRAAVIALLRAHGVEVEFTP